MRASKASVGTGLAHFSIAMLHAKAVSSVSSLATKGTYFEPNAKQVAGYSLGHLHGPSLKSTAKLPPTEKTEKSGSVFLTFELNLYKEKLRYNSHVVHRE